MKTNVFEKIKEFKDLVKATYPRITDKELFIAVDHIVRVQDGVRKHLDEKEMVVKDILLKWGYKPKTLRLYLLYLNYPLHIRDKIERGELTLKEARVLYRDFLMKTDDKLEQEILDDIRRSVASIPDYIDGGVDNARREL